MKAHTVRIIAGKWRGRRLRVLEVKGLRPTPDRVRETLFNWLAPIIPGANCLDLFAGTGILGFEALSRGAKRVEMVDQSLPVIKHLQAVCQQLQTTAAHIHHGTLPTPVATLQGPFEIVFLDPPYAANLLFVSCQYLETQQLLAKSALIYLEANHLIQDNDLPPGWQIIKHARAGAVFYHLAKRESA